MEAYKYAEAVPDENGMLPPVPRELADLSYIERFGVSAVYGRSFLSYGEIQRMMVAENIVQAYLSRKAAQNGTNWAKWAAENPRADDLLKEIEVLIFKE